MKFSLLVLLQVSLVGTTFAFNNITPKITHSLKSSNKHSSNGHSSNDSSMNLQRHSNLHAVPPSSSAFLNSQDIPPLEGVVGTTPFYAYSKERLEESASQALAFPNAYGLTVRYAMKALPTRAVLQIFRKSGIKIDASSVFEVERAVMAGYEYSDISLSTQELGEEFKGLVEKGVKVNCCSLDQLRKFGSAFPGGKCGVRINPGVGSGGFSKSTTGFSKTNVGGPSSSFGIWVGSVEDGTVGGIVEEYGIEVERIHTHIGSGSDPEIWKQVAVKSLSFAETFPTVTSVNLGGGYKVGRNPDEVSTDLQEIGEPVKQAFIDFKEKNGREIKLEIEPGTFLVANAGCVVSKVQDIVTTSEYTFLKLDCGMTDLLRPSLYGAIHPVTVLPSSGSQSDVGTETEDAVVVGHCCESGDLMTPLPGEPESLGTREVRKASIGDYCVIDGSGAYCSGMSTKNYNSFPEAGEVLVEGGKGTLIRKRQRLEQMLVNEIDI
eukprot:CAMPEP_0118645250 /NCGR_PEP_ID=MMETSP0785-20121206/7396_1 /TAXON_ID=91992 /ORGANISM="Bolidomonas pacifica, Strain CCMP 1866" /LENGTH=490 /DNA_ID=CAMNT_0006537111 /DNA_START=1 /DNA_END=1473 /DNA_ORIENTATION=+